MEITYGKLVNKIDLLIIYGLFNLFSFNKSTNTKNMSQSANENQSINNADSSITNAHNIEERMINNIYKFEDLLKNDFLIDAYREILADETCYIGSLYKNIQDGFNKYTENQSIDVMVEILQNCSMIEDYYQKIICFKQLRNENTDDLYSKLWAIKSLIESLERSPNMITNLQGLKKKNLETRKYIELLQRTYKELNINNADEHISELLSSVYSPQRNKYIMGLYNGYFYPIDYQLFNIVNQLIKEGYIPGGWDYHEDKECFISVKGHKKIYGNKLSPVKKQLIELFGEENVNGKKEKNDEKITIHIHNAKNERLETFIGINFSHTIIPKIEEILQTPPNNHIILPGKADVERICKIDNREMTRITRNMHHKNINNREIFG